MSQRICLIDLPGLSRDLLEHVPPASALGKWIAGQRICPLTPSWPAVTCSVQATLTTGVPPARHGIVANGVPTFRWRQDADLTDPSNFPEYRRQISFWEQSNQFVEHRRFWQYENGQSRFKTALLFFQNSMPGFTGAPRPAADIVVTPKPEHGADGKLTSLCWGDPPDLVDALTAELGPFPLMNYWGPMAGIASSQWIVRSGASIWRRHRPTLQLVYVPHLDYDLQRYGPAAPQARQAVIDVAAALEPLFDAVLSDHGRIVLLSEYSMREMHAAVAPNRALAGAGLLVTRQTDDGKLVDYEKSSAFAMVDHQIAHLYARDADAQAKARRALENERLSILDKIELEPLGLNHRRAGDLFLKADEGTWFDYRWWTDLADAPAFASTVDIHRKPGFDPLELFLDPAVRGTSQDTRLLRGGHGLVHPGEAVLIGSAEHISETALEAGDVARKIMEMLS